MYIWRLWLIPWYVHIPWFVSCAEVRICYVYNTLSIFAIKSSLDGQLWIQASVLTDCKHIRNFNSMFLWDHKLVFQSMMFLFQLWKVDTTASTVCIWVCCCISGVVSFTWRTVSLKDLLKLLMFKLRLFSWTLRWDLYGQLLRHNRCPLYSVSLAPEIFQ